MLRVRGVPHRHPRTRVKSVARSYARLHQKGVGAPGLFSIRTWHARGALRRYSPAQWTRTGYCRTFARPAMAAMLRYECS